MTGVQTCALPISTGYLVAKYKNIQTALNLNDTNNISFTIDTSAASKSASRFMIVFCNKNPLSVTGMQIKASVKEKGIVVDWSLISEINVDHYIVERSTNAKIFEAIESQNAYNVNNSQYSYTDNKASVGVNYYRIKAISKDGAIQYSSIATVTIGDSKEGISVYPNPVVGRVMNLQLNNLMAGNYSVTMYNSAGQQIMLKNIAHKGGSATATVTLLANVSTGLYQLELSGSSKNYFETVIVK